MRNADLKKISEDMALNSDAVRVVIFIESRGKGKHPISNDRFRTVLHMAGPKKVSLALRLAESSGWISREKGGWGGADLYEFHSRVTRPDPAKMEGTGDLFDPAIMEGTEKSLTLPGGKAQGTPDPAKMEGTTRARAPLPPPHSTNTPSSKPARAGIDPRVDVALEDDTWTGCRGALRDYFSDRVERDRQWPYLMTVKTWFDGGIGTPRGFGKLTLKDKRLAIASAVNEILQLSPADEKKRFASSHGISGNAATLRTSIEFHIRRLDEPYPPWKSTRGEEPAKKKYFEPDESEIGGNQPEFFPEEIEYMKEHGLTPEEYRGQK